MIQFRHFGIQPEEPANKTDRLSKNTRPNYGRSSCYLINTFKSESHNVYTIIQLVLLTDYIGVSTGNSRLFITAVCSLDVNYL